MDQKTSPAPLAETLPAQKDLLEAAAFSAAILAEVDRATDARSKVAKRQGLPIVCASGCAGCCEEMVMGYLPEVYLVVHFLMQSANQGAREAFLRDYPKWSEQVGDAPGRLGALLDKGDTQGYNQAHREQWGKRILCPFNEAGEGESGGYRCRIYEVRPTSCRNAHAVTTHERCSGANLSGPPASRLSFAPLDQYLVSAEGALRAVHLQLCQEHPVLLPFRRPTALAEAVYQMLQQLAQSPSLD